MKTSLRPDRCSCGGWIAVTARRDKAGGTVLPIAGRRVQSGSADERAISKRSGIRVIPIWRQAERNFRFASSSRCPAHDGRSALHLPNAVNAWPFRAGIKMTIVTTSHDALLAQLKESSGRRSEGERRRQFLSQRQFAARVGISIRWLREIESGNPAVKLEDHLRCGAALGLAPSHIFFPLLFHAHGKPLSADPPHHNQADLEYRCIRLIARHTQGRRTTP